MTIENETTKKIAYLVIASSFAPGMSGYLGRSPVANNTKMLYFVARSVNRLVASHCLQLGPVVSKAFSSNGG